MHPILFELNLGFVTIPLHTYGFLIAIGFLVSIAVMRRLAVRSQVNPDIVSDLAFWLLMTGFLGARVLFIITRFDFFLQNPLDMFKVWEGGLVFFGGLISATAFGVWYVRKHKLSIWKMIDIIMPGVVTGHAFGRLGCLGAGCCYGRPTDASWGIKLNSDLVDIQLRGIPLHPTQLYESVALFILLGGLLYIFKRRKFEGQVGLTYFMIYPIIRSIVEIFRGDSIRGFVIDDILSTSQFISIFVFLAALFVLLSRLKKANGKTF